LLERRRSSLCATSSKGHGSRACHQLLLSDPARCSSAVGRRSAPPAVKDTAHARVIRCCSVSPRGCTSSVVRRRAPLAGTDTALTRASSQRQRSRCRSPGARDVSALVVRTFRVPPPSKWLLRSALHPPLGGSPTLRTSRYPRRRKHSAERAPG